MAKSPEAFRTISEAAEQLDLPQHVLRHWEEVFGHIRPMRRAGGRRYYRTYDIELLNGVRTLLYDEKYTTKGVQKIFKENGAQFVAELGRRALAGEDVSLSSTENEEPAVEEDHAEETVSEQEETVTEEQAAPMFSMPEEEAPQEVSEVQATSVIDAEFIEDLKELLVRLETVQDSLDDVILSVDAIAIKRDE